MSILDSFKRTTISVETYTGSGGDGDLFATAVARSVMVEDKRRQVRDVNGQLTVSETTLYDELAAAAIYTPGSRLTVNGRVTSVIVCSRNELSDPEVDHVAVNLQ